MNTITVTIPNLKKLQSLFSKAPLKMTNEVHRAIQKTVLVIEGNTKREAPVNKQSGGGNLRQSIRSSMLGIASGKVEVGAAYGAFVELGTRPHTITVKNKKALANKRTGQFFGRTVHHPGTKANNFFTRGVEKSIPEIKDTFAKAIENVFKS